jgi:hypothetical protein
MKNSLIALLLLFMCGCSAPQGFSDHASALELITDGSQTSWNGGIYVLHVAERHGSSIHDVRLVCHDTGRPDTIFSAATGTITRGSEKDPEDENSVLIALSDASRIGGDMPSTGLRVVFELKR